MSQVEEEQQNLAGRMVAQSENAKELKSSVKRLRLWKRRQWTYGYFVRVTVSAGLIAFYDGTWFLPLAIFLGGLADSILGLYIAKYLRREIPIVLANAHGSSELGSLLQVYPLVSNKAADSVLDAIARILEAPAAGSPINLSASDKRRLYRYLNSGMAGKSPTIVLAILAHITATQDTSALARVRAYRKQWPIGKLGEAVNHCLEVLTAAEENRLLRPSQSPVLEPLLRPAERGTLGHTEVLVRVADTPRDLQTVQARGEITDT